MILLLWLVVPLPKECQRWQVAVFGACAVLLQTTKKKIAFIVNYLLFTGLCVAR